MKKDTSEFLSEIITIIIEINEFFGCDSINYLFLITKLAIFILLFALNSLRKLLANNRGRTSAAKM